MGQRDVVLKRWVAIRRGGVGQEEEFCHAPTGPTTTSDKPSSEAVARTVAQV
jgi:hypothetical protein